MQSFGEGGNLCLHLAEFLSAISTPVSGHDDYPLMTFVFMKPS